MTDDLDLSRFEPSTGDPRGRGRKSRLAIFATLADRIEDLRTHLGGLPSPLEAEDIWGDIWYQETHNSTAIEGNTLVLKQVEILLREKRAVGDKRLSEYLEVQGYAEAAKWVYGQALEPKEWTAGELLSLTEVRQVHRLIMTPVWEVEPHLHANPGEGPGNFRQHDIHAFAGGMKPSPWTDVPALVVEWIRSVLAISTDERPFPEALADRHAEFERIHPFLDGNGRVGRLLVNLILIRLGYPPAIIRKAHRDRYLKGLRKADSADVGPLGEFLARNILETLDRFIVPAIAGPLRLVPLPALVDREITLRALREAAVRGRLRASHDSQGRWLSTRQWVNEYKRNRSPRGRPQNA